MWVPLQVAYLITFFGLAGQWQRQDCQDGNGQALQKPVDDITDTTSILASQVAHWTVENDQCTEKKDSWPGYQISDTR